ncbi:MAG: hypothetical protein OXJ53_22110, partial [Gammaproteobacteria bacterium]|nr:hypothetical protein [Gammaproteobacteria bacterium]MDE0273529.1 hypothetical protein [Gammaproteobacteria bacterium]
MASRRIVITIDGQAHDVLKSYAARRNTTIGGLVRAYLMRIAEAEQRALEARERIRAMNRKPQNDDPNP